MVVPAGAKHNIVNTGTEPQGPFVLSSDVVVIDSGAPDIVAPSAVQTAVEDRPDSALIHWPGSRCCETELPSDIACRQFAAVPTGWARVQAICAFVHQDIAFG